MAQGIVFYTNPMSRGRIAGWALEEVGAQISWGLQQGTLKARNRFQKYAETVTARKAHKKSTALDEALM